MAMALISFIICISNECFGHLGGGDKSRAPVSRNEDHQSDNTSIHGWMDKKFLYKIFILNIKLYK